MPIALIYKYNGVQTRAINTDFEKYGEEFTMNKILTIIVWRSNFLRLWLICKIKIFLNVFDNEYKQLK